MKITTVTLGETQIEFHNSVFGRETIKVNGEVVSSKKSLSGTEHVFDVDEGGKIIQYKLLTGLNLNGIAIDLFRDGTPVIQSLKRGKFGFWLVFIAALVIGALLFTLVKDLL